MWMWMIMINGSSIRRSYSNQTEIERRQYSISITLYTTIKSSNNIKSFYLQTSANRVDAISMSQASCY